MDVQLSALDHDLVFEGNDLKLTTTESESLAQRLKVKLLTFQKEWFLDINEGIPYYESILGKRRSKQTIDSIFKKAILSEPEVVSIVTFESVVTPQRNYELRFTVRSTNESESVPVDLII